MNLTNEYYYFTEAIDKKTCNKIMKTGGKDFGEAVVGHGGESIVDKEVRTSKTAWSNDQWIYDLIWPYMEEANAQAAWEYDIKAAESVQITRYEKGGFYTFHKDGKSDNLGAYNEPQNKFRHGNVRKLSMSIILNDDYEGGGFEFATLDKETSNIYTPDFNKLGSIMVFPSFMTHRVKPVTKGTRYSAVSWFLGPPFK
jgi:PKHD-type hydroxylase|tara:strand:+ start:754 stop:1347 length:594 start_codon:yes stop_codon:yes gene_type:complete